MEKNRFIAAVAAFLTVACFAAEAVHAELGRRISATAGLTYFILDSEFFDLENGIGTEAAIRYELWNDIYFENALGVFDSGGCGTDVNGFDYRLNMVAIFPVLIPYRPVARFGIGFLSVDPVTVTPTESFRPGQTTFYLCGGAGVTRSLGASLLLEMNASFWITPYEYRIYRFDRREVTVNAERFTHIGITVSGVYTF